jgi:hypothetical protein
MSFQELDEKGQRVGVSVWYPELPPTTNKLYYLGKRLTEVAREYRERFKMHISQNYLHVFQDMPQPNAQAVDNDTGDMVDVRTKDPNLVFGMDLYVYMDTLTSWGDQSRSVSSRAKFRFVKSDLSNRLKFVEDCFKWSIGIDDSLTFFSRQMKIHSPAKEGVLINYYVMPIETFNVPRVSGELMK